MSDPYLILGVSRNSTDDQIREAYRELSKKYHPDFHQQSPLSDLAEEKMKELNQAYDEIMDLRRGNASYGNTGSSNQQSYTGQSSASPEFSEIRRQIQNGNLTVADDMLENSGTTRNAEWSFLKGSVCYARGWLNDAYTHFSNAVRQEPNNAEYNAALNQMMQARRGNMNGMPNSPYRTNNTLGGCSTCDLCTGLCCADSCCECMGGDIVPCC